MVYLPSEVNYYDDMLARDLLNYSQSFYEEYNSNKILELSERFDLDLNKKIDVNLNFNIFILMSFAPFMLHLVFSSISFLMSSLMKKSRNVISLSLRLIFVMYFLDIVSSIEDKYQAIKYVTPFEYVNPIDIIINKSLNTTYIGIMTGLVLISISSTYIIYQKKDVTI